MVRAVPSTVFFLYLRISYMSLKLMLQVTGENLAAGTDGCHRNFRETISSC
jgi:hypothetical protein